MDLISPSGIREMIFVVGVGEHTIDKTIVTYNTNKKKMYDIVKYNLYDKKKNFKCLYSSYENRTFHD